MSPILPFIRLPVVVESVSRVTGPRPGNIVFDSCVINMWCYLRVKKVLIGRSGDLERK